MSEKLLVLDRPARRSQAERREESRRKLLDAAAFLVADTRSLTFTLAEVGERAGYSRGLPSQTFGNKAGLISELVRHLLQRSDDSTQPHALRGEGLNAVLTTVRLLFDAPAPYVELLMAVQVLLLEGARPSSPYRADIASLNRTATGYLAKHLRLAMEKGEVRPEIDSKAQAMLILAAVRGALLQHQVDPERIALSSLRDELISSLKRTLVPTPR